MISLSRAPIPATYNRVPKVTVDFWFIKLMAVTMGETAADYLAVNLGLGLTATSLIMACVLAGAMVLQFGQKRYLPWSYWLAVVLVGIVGRLMTDILVNNFGVSLVTTTIGFSLALIATFALWHRSEKNPVDPFDLYHQMRGVLLAGDPVYLCAGNSGR